MLYAYFCIVNIEKCFVLAIVAMMFSGRHVGGGGAKGGCGPPIFWKTIVFCS